MAVARSLHGCMGLSVVAKGSADLLGLLQLRALALTSLSEGCLNLRVPHLKGPHIERSCFFKGGRRTGLLVG